MVANPQGKRGRPVDPELQARRREEILEVAARLFAEHGYPNTEVKSVADALEIGNGTVYRYFASKEDLFLAAVERGLQVLREHLNAIPVDMEPLEHIRRCVQMYLGFFKDNPHYAELLIQERAEFRDRKQHSYFTKKDEDITRWHDFFGELMRAGRVRTMPVERLMDVLGDLVYGTMFTNHFSGRHKPLETQARDIMDIVFFGILTDAERRAQEKGD